MAPPVKTTCRTCGRTILVVVSATGERTTLDPEILSVHVADLNGLVIPSGSPVYARRIHAEMCSTYKELREKEAHVLELRAFNRRREGL